ncbi:MAG: hypothetical protein FD123_2753 [Bacteroidetes bacterium]|nr:MAG: hypothetical protein FD123_2753 [Bacteroidota bacterium]
MIDFIKGRIISNPALAETLRNGICERVDINHKTAETDTAIFRGKIGDFEILVYSSNLIRVKGSIHKYYEGGTNSSDFTYSMFLKTVNRFCGELGIKPIDFLLENVEFGVNILLPYSAKIILDNVVCLKTGLPFSHQQGGGLCFKRKEYRHKLYDKSAQYQLTGFLLRYEIHADKMRLITPVKTLHDLTIPEVWTMFQQELCRYFQEIIFTDTYTPEKLKKWNKKYYKQYADKINNSRFWKGLAGIDRYRHHLRLKRLQQQGTHNFSIEIVKLIEKKAVELKSR